MDNLRVDDQTTTPNLERAVDKPAGRGLDEISRVLLNPKKTEPPPAEPVHARLTDRITQAASAPRVLQLRPTSSVNRATLASMIKELQDGVEYGLRVLDMAVACYPVGEIDLLAIDRSNQLVIIDFDTASSETLLLRGMAHYNWVVHNLANFERMYAQEGVNLMAEPRLFLLAPKFSPLLTNAARHLTQPRIQWMRYHVVDALPGVFGILFERVTEA